MSNSVEIARLKSKVTNPLKENKASLNELRGLSTITKVPNKPHKITVKIAPFAAMIFKYAHKNGEDLTEEKEGK